MRLLLFCIALLSVLATPGFAHPVAGSTDFFAAGVAHPFGGADHLITITFAGLWSGLVGRTAMVAWPVTFVAAMLGGFAAASAGLQPGFVEAATSLSVILLGAFVAFELTMPVVLGATVTGLLAFFHGHAHGTEATSVLLPYVTGFTTATVALLAVGIAVAVWTKSFAQRVAVRVAGGCAAVAGLLLLGGLA
jgi:urease accessory protein